MEEIIPTPPSRKRSKSVNIRMLPAQWVQLHQAARQADEPLGRFMVQASLHYAEEQRRREGRIARGTYVPAGEAMQQRVDEFKERYWFLEEIGRLAQQGLDAGAQIARLQVEVGRLMDEVGRRQGVQQGAREARGRGKHAEEA